MPASAANIWIASRSARSTASTRARTCSSSTRRECIDCGVCEPECPAEAILPDTESGLEQWLEVNATYSAEWPNITRKKDSPADADEHKGEEGKFDKYFTAEPGEGD